MFSPNFWGGPEIYSYKEVRNCTTQSTTQAGYQEPLQKRLQDALDFSLSFCSLRFLEGEDVPSPLLDH